MFNKIIMAGNLTRDIELKYLPSGTAMANTALATNRRFKKQDGSQGEEVCFIDLSFMGRTAEIANQYLKRGSKVLVEGRLKLEQWTDQQGQKKSKHLIQVEVLQMLDGKNQGESNEASSDEPSYTQTSAGVPVYDKRQQPQHSIPDININDDEIPF